MPLMTSRRTSMATTADTSLKAVGRGWVRDADSGVLLAPSDKNFISKLFGKKQAVVHRGRSPRDLPDEKTYRPLPRPVRQRRPSTFITAAQQQLLVDRANRPKLFEELPLDLPKLVRPPEYIANERAGWDAVLEVGAQAVSALESKTGFVRRLVVKTELTGVLLVYNSQCNPLLLCEVEAMCRAKKVLEALPGTVVLGGMILPCSADTLQRRRVETFHAYGFRERATMAEKTLEAFPGDMTSWLFVDPCLEDSVGCLCSETHPQVYSAISQYLKNIFSSTIIGTSLMPVYIKDHVETSWPRHTFMIYAGSAQASHEDDSEVMPEGAARAVANAGGEWRLSSMNLVQGVVVEVSRLNVMLDHLWEALALPTGLDYLDRIVRFCGAPCMEYIRGAFAQQKASAAWSDEW
eukprot:TRINITY_DN8020_c0_g1_i2.p1 TRINITY_DN8020_c0_g1~~TRINITY_DN8020_c0_g1_i2.p1  ORF type:complete len:407 (-),score=88.54 TRINITY_DN8020_c0_g1_i2:50-1270(-)